MLSSSLGAVPSTQMRQSPHSHVRSISHDSYFEFTFDRRQEQRPVGELSTIMSEENDDDDDDDDDSDRVVLDDFCDVATDLDLMKLHYVDQDTDINIIGHVNDGLESVTLDETSTSLSHRINDVANCRHPPDILNLCSSDKILNDGSDTLASESLHEQLSLDFDNGHCDIVGDIQQEVAAALHWDQSTLNNLRPPSLVEEGNDSCVDALSPETLNRVTNLKDNSKPHSKTVVERYGSERTVIVEVHATEDSSAEEDDGKLISDIATLKVVLPYDTHEDNIACQQSDTIKTDLREDSVIGATHGPLSYPPALLSPLTNNLTPLDSKEMEHDNLVQKRDLESFSQGCSDDHEYSNLASFVQDTSPTFSSLLIGERVVDGLTLGNLNETLYLTSDNYSPEVGVVNIRSSRGTSPSMESPISNVKEIDCSINHFENGTSKDDTVNEVFPRIFVRESTLPSTDDQSAGFPVNCIELNEDGTIISSVSVSGLDPVCALAFDSDSSPGSHVNSHDEVTSNTSPSGASDPFGYSVLMNEEEAPLSPISSVATFDVEPFSDQLKRNDDKLEPFICLTSPINESKESRNGNNDVNSQIPSLPNISSGFASQMEGNETDIINQSSMQVADICPLDAEFILPSLPSPLLPSRESDEITPHLRKPSLYLEKLSPVEESKRKFESEIGRDILRERKMKLELEKIQLEQQKCEKLSPSRLDSQISDSKVTTPSDRIPKSTLGDDIRFPGVSPSNNLNFEVELRRQKCHHSQQPGSGISDSKRTSEPSLGFGHSQPSTPDSVESKRHSEPVPYTGKGVRPERKASVRELMSKFEGKPRVQKRGTVGGNEGHEESVDVSSRKLQLSLKIDNTSMLKAAEFDSVLKNSSRKDGQQRDDFTADHFCLRSQQGDNVVEISSPLPLNPLDVLSSPPLDDIFSMSSSFPNSLVSSTKLEAVSTSSDIVRDPLSHEPMNLSCSSVCNDANDVARRERIDRYKEERRAQLRERIKSESFRGEQDVHSDYLAKLKQKASSPMKSVGSCEDITALPSSPSRRGRLSTTSLESPTESFADRGFSGINQRRSFNARISASYLPSSPGSEEVAPPIGPPKVVLDKKCGLPIPPPSSPRKTTRPERTVTGDVTSETSRSRFGTPDSVPGSSASRPKDLPCQKQDGFHGQPSRRMSPKTSPSDSLASRKLKSPMKERTYNLPPSPTKDRYITCEDDDPCLKDARGTKASPVAENVPSNMGMKHKPQKGRIPVPPPRKIKEVAAIFEPEKVLGSVDLLQPDGSCSRPRPMPKPAPGNIQRQTSLSATDSSSNQAQRLRSKHLSGPD